AMRLVQHKVEGQVLVGDSVCDRVVDGRLDLVGTRFEAWQRVVAVDFRRTLDQAGVLTQLLRIEEVHVAWPKGRLGERRWHDPQSMVELAGRRLDTRTRLLVQR